jgi:predicted CoA-binding protein
MDADDARTRKILEQTATIAMVGASPSPDRPSYSVMAFLQSQGYRVFPVNPRCIGQEILGEPVYGALAEVPGTFDLVDVFRSSEAAGEVADEVIAVATEKGIRAVWMQIGVRDDAAANRAVAAGLEVVMDRCPKVEYLRLGVRQKARSPR